MPLRKHNKPNELSRSKKLKILSYRQGLRHAIFNTSGDKYIGDWEEDIKKGKGSMYTRDNRLYEGDWEQNYRHGFGTLAEKIPSCNVYKLVYRGDWKNGHMHGHGTRVYPDESFYIGDFSFSKRSGNGQMWYSDGGFYHGKWYKDQRCGEGLLVRPDGNRYEGEWENDLKHGKGMFYHLDSGQLQAGIWRNGFCVYSTMQDIPFRQTSKDPSAMPIIHLQLKNIDDITQKMERTAVKEVDPCEIQEDSESSYSSSYSSQNNLL